MIQNIQNIKNELNTKLDSFRYEHTLAVMYTASSLAMRYDCDIEKALLAGLLHDCAKCIPHDEAIKFCNKHHISLKEVEIRNPLLIHSKLGAFLAKEEYRIDDDEIINAIYYHTTGKPNMTLLEKIIFVADYIEPNRNKAKNLEEIRKYAFKKIDKAVAMILRDTLDYLKSKSNEIDIATEITFNHYKKYL